MDEFKTLYGELFDLFSDSKWSNSELAAFKLQVGKNYSNGPLFVGKAPNGWTPFCPSEWNRDDFIQDPMFPDGDTSFSDWIANDGNDHYKLSTSEFWIDAEKIFNGLYNGNFSTDIAYSNLYKIAQPEGNPLGAQRNAQLEICRKILLAEITELKPNCVVFLAGDFTNCFFGDWENDDVRVKLKCNGPVKGNGSIAGCPFIIIHHPMYKRCEVREQAVNAVINYFRNDDEGYNEDESQ